MDKRLAAVVDAVGSVLLGKQRQVQLAVACLIAGGHLLIEDLPGMGKTLLAHALARALGLSFNRVQFTSDLLPADILGVSVFDRANDTFRFHPGPIFSQLLMADEINRTTPKTQSALLEAMEEGQVTTDGETRLLPKPFFVIATQNPAFQTGTYPLPESQLDRFLMRIEIGFPTADAEREIMRGADRRQLIAQITPQLSAAGLLALCAEAERIKTSDALIDYVFRLVQHTRRSGEFGFGLSPRGSLAMLRSAKAWALLHGRPHVLPEDVQAVLPAVVEHRLRGSVELGGRDGETQARRLLTQVDVIN